MKQFKINKQGFTLIELLIVIALLGALAMGLLATIDPFEQLKRGTDSQKQNIVVEFANASARYYANNQSLPWGNAALTTTALNAAPIAGAVGTLITSSELKTGFNNISSAIQQTIVVSAGANGSGVTACFSPLSKQFRNDPNSKYNQDGSTGGGAAGCPNATLTTCNWCAM
jgi:prepilin-type N-terminal cleavage/methylation domain-containing protein